MSLSRTQAGHKTVDQPLTIRVNGIGPLLERAAHTPEPRDIVLAPVAHHQRTVKRRLASAGQPLASLVFLEPAMFARSILNTSAESPRSLDRIDRIAIMEALLAEPGQPRSSFRRLLGVDPATNVQAVEQTRSEIEAMTNYHPQRLRVYRKTASQLADAIEADALDALEGVLAVEQSLRQQSAHPPSSTEVLRRATRELMHDRSVWPSNYTAVKRVTALGLSNVPAPLLDFLTAIAQRTELEVEVFLRPASGAHLHHRYPQATVATPGEVYVG